MTLIKLLIFIIVFTFSFYELRKLIIEKNIVKLDYRKLKISALATSLFMSASYMYAWFKGNLLFDTSFIYRGEIKYGSVMGEKWFAPIVAEIIDKGYNISWFGGLVSTFFMIVSVYCLIEVLNIESTLAIILIAGICSTNSSIIAMNQYAGTCYIGSLALMLACLSLYVLFRTSIKKLYEFIIASLLIALSAGTYGAYVSVVPSIMIILGLLHIWEGKSAKDNWREIIRDFFVFLSGMIIYYLVLRLLMHATGIKLQSYMGQDKLERVTVVESMWMYIPAAYRDILFQYIRYTGTVPRFVTHIMRLALLFGGIIFLFYVIEKWKEMTDRVYNAILFVILMLVLPGAINLIYIMSFGDVHMRMKFTYCVPFLLFVKLIDNDKTSGIVNKRGIEEYRKWSDRFYIVTVCIFLYYSIVTANVMFVHFNAMDEEAKSISTRLIDRIETLDGFTGQENIVFVGEIENNTYFKKNLVAESELLNAHMGSYLNKNPIHTNELLINYLHNIMNIQLPMSEINKDTLNENRDLIEEMSVFPQSGCVIKNNNSIYVKLSHVY